MRGWKIVSVLLVLLFTASTSFAGGFRLPEQGAKAMGMGFAFTAQADDPSAIYFNPAGLTQLKGSNVMVGVTYVRLNGGEFTGTTPVDNVFANKSETQKSLDLFIPSAYYTKTTSDGHIAYGVGIFAPFGLGQEYENKSTSIFRNQITKIDLQTVVVNPTIAFKVNEFLSIGLGIDWMYGKATLKQTPWNPALIPAGQNGNAFDLELEGDGDAWGYNFGFLLKPTENLKIGANYRSPFTLKIKEGDVTVSSVNAGAPGFAAANGTQGSATIAMPATFALGASYTMGKLTLNADADWTFWSSYSSLPIDFTSPALRDSNAAKNWEDVCAVRLGVEYRVTAPLALRAGFVYDPTPAPASTMGPELPDADKMDYMVGVGYKIGAWTIDVAGMYVDKKDRTVNNQNNATLTGFNGTWTGDSWLAGLDITYNF
jgi:long-chain fatty acid transport protein